MTTSGEYAHDRCQVCGHSQLVTSQLLLPDGPAESGADGRANQVQTDGRRIAWEVANQVQRTSESAVHLRRVHHASQET
jgi:hypothetical protein